MKVPTHKESDDMQEHARKAFLLDEGFRTVS